MVAVEMALEAKQEEEENSALRIGGRSFKGLKLSPMKLFQAATKKGEAASSSAPTTSGALGEADEDEQAWPRELMRVTNLIVDTGLSLVDARGKSILPKRPPKKAAVQTYVAPVLIDNVDQPDEVEEHLGLRLRVWHRDAEGNRANFLGSIVFTEEVFQRFIMFSFISLFNYLLPIFYSYLL